MKWSQHRLNANKHLIRFQAVVSCFVHTVALCCAAACTLLLSLCLVAVCFALLCIPLLSHTLRFDLTQHNSVSIRYCILMAKAISVYACNWCVPSLLCRIAAAAGVDIYPCVSRHCFYMCSLSHSLSLSYVGYRFPYVRRPNVCNYVFYYHESLYGATLTPFKRV